MDSFTVIPYANPAVIEAAPDNPMLTNEERGGSGGNFFCIIA